MENTIQDLAERAWSQYDKFSGEHPVVEPPSIPILYFGNLESYADSNRRVVTVGHNPSASEFPGEETEEPDRFETPLGEKPATKDYLEDLNDYFERNPYRSWFQHYEEVLNGMGASYYGDESREKEETFENRAVHTDLHSPLATDPTWSGLNATQKRRLAKEGERLWLDLIELLEPDVILASLPKGDITGLNFPSVGDLVYPETRDEREKRYHVEAWKWEVGGSTATVVYGRKAQVPFQYFDDETKREVGEEIEGHLTEN